MNCSLSGVFSAKNRGSVMHFTENPGKPRHYICPTDNTGAHTVPPRKDSTTHTVWPDRHRRDTSWQTPTLSLSIPPTNVTATLCVIRVICRTMGVNRARVRRPPPMYVLYP